MWFGDDLEDVKNINDDAIGQLTLTIVDAQVLDFSGSTSNRITRRHPLKILGMEAQVAHGDMRIGVRFVPRKGKDCVYAGAGGSIDKESGLIQIIVPDKLENVTYDIEILMQAVSDGVEVGAPVRLKLRLKKGVRPTKAVPPVGEKMTRE